MMPLSTQKRPRASYTIPQGQRDADQGPANNDDVVGQ